MPPHPSPPRPATATASAPTAPPRVRLRTVALPNEHGAWGFWLEPVVLALLVAPSVAGGLLALAGLVAVFAQHPLSLALADAARGRVYPRTRLAWRVLAVEAPLGGALVAGGLWLGGPAVLVPLVLAAPFALVQLAYERRNRGRDLVPELLGPLAMAALAPAIVLAGGAGASVAAAAWLLLAARDVPTILYVRARLRLERGAPSPRAALALPALVTAAAAVVVAAVLAAVGWAPAVAPVVAAALLARAALGLSPWRRPTSARAIGIRELLFGALAATLLGAAWGPWGG